MAFGQDAFRLSCLAKPSGNKGVREPLSTGGLGVGATRASRRFPPGRALNSARAPRLCRGFSETRQDNPQIRVLPPLEKSQLTNI